MSKRTQPALLATCAFLLAGALASAQTLTVVEPSSHTESAPLSSIRGGTAPVNGPTEIPHHPLPLQANYKNGGRSTEDDAAPDALLQSTPGPLINATAGANFDGMNVNQGGYIPSDNNIAVGPNHIVETVNAAYAIYNKSGTLLLGPNALRSMWAGLGGQCAANNGGDPIVQYDRAADRWMITQLGSLSNPYAECIAVSKTADPTGAYYLWAYSFGTDLNDYPKFGVWSTATNSAYLATYNLFPNGGSFSSSELCAYDRAAMLAGAASPKALCYTGISGASYLPSDVDGATPPADGTAAYFVDIFSTSGSLGMYKMSPNFATSSATLTFSTIAVAPYTQAASVPQPGTTRLLDSLSDRAMYRLAYRVFSDHESMALTHSVTTGGVSGARWYELRHTPPSTSFTLFQQGTFAPGDGVHRWMGSIAMDQAGDMALGYSASSGSLFPSVRYTGRIPSDPAGTMETEASIKEGAGSQTGYSRWGDYSSMRVDPSDDCTFWYVNEYLPVTSSAGWYTRIGSFKFSGCGGAPAPDFSLSATPSSQSVVVGNSATYSVTVTSLNSFNSAVALSMPNCPATATCSFSPASVTPPAGGSVPSTLTIIAPTGNYSSLTISGNSGVHTTSVALTVTPAPDFSVSASPSITVTRGASGTSTVTITSVGGFSNNVTLSATNCPTDTTCTFAPNPVTGGSGTSTLTVQTSATSPTGTISLGISATDGTITHTTSVSLTINPAAADFTLGLSTSSLNVKKKSSNSLTVNLGGGPGSVTLSVSGLPTKVTASFSSNPTAAPGSSTLTISANPAAAVATYTITVTGTSGGNTHSATFTLNVTN